MKKSFILLLSVALSFTTLAVLSSSCIRKEAPNAEADITKVEISGAKLLREAEITNNEVKMLVQESDDLKNIVSTFTLSKGATISPANGIAQDFTNPITYTVTAEDKKTKKVYKVSITKFSKGNNKDPKKKEESSITFSFENIRIQGTDNNAYQVFQIKGVNGIVKGTEWASSNLGYALTGQAKKPQDFPAIQEEKGYKGKCLKLETKSTGEAGALFKAYLATGSLFLGKIDKKTLIGSPLEATQFGIPFGRIPTKFSGVYQYTAGKEFKEADKPVKDKKDIFDLYAVLYEATKETPLLDGTNSLTSTNIILMARIENAKETKEWTSFEIPFKEMNGKKIDSKKLAEGKYNFTIIASSSKEGAKHFGAIGSTLLLDEIKVTLAK